MNRPEYPMLNEAQFFPYKIEWKFPIKPKKSTYKFLFLK